MAIPSFVTAAAQVSNASAATLTTTLPGSRVNNNVLWAFVFVQSAGLTIATATPGWAIISQDATNGATAAVAWRLVDGTEAAPVFTWTGSFACHGQCQQYTGNLTPNPIGASAWSAGAGTTASATGVTSTADNSLATALDMTNTNGIPGNPTDRSWSSGGYNTAQGSFLGSTGGMFKTGTTSGSISETILSSNWKVFLFELKGTGSAPLNEPQVRATQTLQPMLESNSRATNVRATQVLQPTLESNSRATQVRATQVFISVLRRVAVAPPGVMRKTLSRIGGRIGTRQLQGWGD